MIRYALTLLTILALVIPALAAEETKSLDELQALKIKVLMLERQLIQEQAARVQAQASLQHQEKAKALDAAVVEAAKAADLDVKDGWQADVNARVWVRPIK